MTYVIAAACVADYSCVEVCPVDAISPSPSSSSFIDAEQLYINPELCIDCSVCAKVCPVLAIYDEDALPKIYEHYAAVNREYFEELKAESN